MAKQAVKRRRYFEGISPDVGPEFSDLVSAGVTAATQRWLAVSAGDLLGATKHEVGRALVKARRNRFGAVKLGLERLRESNLITQNDFRSLSGIVDAVSATVSGSVDPNTAFGKVRETYYTMLADSTSSPTALAIASVATNAFTVAQPGRGSKQEGVTFAVVVQDAATAGAILGATIGAGIGGVIGGGVGATVGAAVGGSVGAAIGECID